MVQTMEEAFHDLITTITDSVSYATNVSEIASIVSYSDGSADVQPLVDDSGGRDEVGVISGCPVLKSALLDFDSDGKGIKRDLKKGDTVLIVFNNRDLDNFSGNSSFTKSSERMHDINDAVVVGVVET